MNTNIAATGSRSCDPAPFSATSTASSVSPPCRATTLTFTRTVMFGVARDLVDQVGGHARCQRVGADEDRDVLGEPGQVDGGLAGGVAASLDRHALAAVEGRLGGRAAVVDAGPRQAVGIREVQLPVLDARRDEERLAAHLRPVGEPDHLVRVLHGHAHDLLRGQDLRPEAAGLGHGSARQVGAGQAGREAQVVVDPRRGPGLAARGLPLHHQGLESLGRPVDGGGQAGRSAAHDDQVVERQGGVRPQADPLGDLGVGRADEVGPVGEDDQRLAGGVDAGAGDELGCLRLRLDVEPAVRDLVAGQVVLDLVGPRRPAVADDPEALERRPEAGLPVARARPRGPGTACPRAGPTA